MDVSIHDSWKKVLKEEFNSPYFTELRATIQKAYLHEESVYPSPKNVFGAFDLCPFEEVRVVILGQDPYHGLGQAHGLSFSVEDGIRIPPSLLNIYKELQTDLGVPISKTGNLSRWAKQGVLLLNAVLTVVGGKPGSHQGLGWETFTDAVIKKISDEREHVVFLLWGKYAGSKESFIDGTKHRILKAPHPSPLSAHTGFMGCKHFSKTNECLREWNLKPLEW
jgi:uracil-DNA glycosylase